MVLDTAAGRLRDGSLAGYVVLPATLETPTGPAEVVSPELHLEGSQPGPAETLTSAVQQATASALSSLPGPVTRTPPRLHVHVTYLYGGPQLDTLDYFGSAYIGLVVFFLVFVITSVSFLRERSQGTLERLMASPVRRGEIVLGYMLGFGVLALLQSAEVLVFCLAVLKIHNSGNALLIFLIEMLVAVAAVNLGIFLSVFARTEFQAVQFIPLVVAPQFLLSGVILPVSGEPGWLQKVSDVLPLTYAVDGLRDVMVKGADLNWASVQLDTGVVAGFGVVAVAAAAATLRRRLD
jgi:ABC-2 type transport system permease protein